MKALPKNNALSEKDVVLPLAPFSDTICRTVTFAALASGTILKAWINNTGSTLLLLSLTDAAAQLNISHQLHPTVVIATHEAVNLLSQVILGFRRDSTISSIRLSLNESKLSSGRLPAGLNEVRKVISDKLRLLYIAVHPNERPISSHSLLLLRAGLGSHIIYSLGPGRAFGPIAQTHLQDYRTDSVKEASVGHFGAPLGGIEIKLSGIQEGGSVNGKVGNVEISGPIASGKDWVNTGLRAKWRKDGCIEVQFWGWDYGIIMVYP
jgi:hypothetical protein